jgi:ParB/RepB/Spo0J family partition protein
MAAETALKGRKLIETRDIPVYQLADAKFINRATRDPKKDQQLRESMASQGLLVSLRVYPEGDHWRIEDGQRRSDQAKMLQWATLRCDIWEPPTDSGVLDGIVVNNVRQDNTAYEIMQAALELQRTQKLGTGAIAKALGVSDAYVRDLIAISGLPAPVHELMHSEALGVPAAKELLRLQTPEEQVRVGFDFAQNHTSGPQATSILNTYLQIRKQQAEMPPAQAMERAKAEPLFTCETCGHNKPIQGSQGKVLCADCWREMQYLWETERRKLAQRQPPNPTGTTIPTVESTWTMRTEQPQDNPQPIGQRTAEQPPPTT